MMSFQHLFSGHWDSESRWLQFASFHFDVSVLEQYWSWSVGIRVVSAPRDLLFEDLPAAIRRLRITHIDLTPSLAKLLHPDDVPDLCRGVFITGGEKLQQEILDVWGPKGVIYNGYGPTEATIGVTMYPRVPSNGKPSNIGPQFENVGSYVFHPDSDILVLRGAVGELCVSGKLVGKGYLNRPDLTAEKFPYLERFKERVYRTGDLVRILHDNTFDFIGRADDQVKLRGQRLEVAEINSVIKEAASMPIDVATLVLKHPSQQRDQLVSFVAASSSTNRKEPPSVLTRGTDTDVVSHVLEACSSKLPPYMVPTHVVPISSIPLSANNKIDGHRLKELYNDLSSEALLKLSSGNTSSQAPLTNAEKNIVNVLKSYASFEEDAVHKSSSIFQLGLDSISVFAFSQNLRSTSFKNATVSLVMNSKWHTMSESPAALTWYRFNDFSVSESSRRNALGERLKQEPVSRRKTDSHSNPSEIQKTRMQYTECVTKSDRQYCSMHTTAARHHIQVNRSRQTSLFWKLLLRAAGYGRYRCIEKSLGERYLFCADPSNTSRAHERWFHSSSPRQRHMPLGRSVAAQRQ